jgi:hypothetical protein
MFLLTTWALRAFGMTGIIGSILFILGDLLYNHIPGSKDSPAVKMSTLPGRRLVNAGTLGLVGCWLYTFASLHLYLAFRPAGDVFAFILLLAFAATSISYGIGHSAYFAIAAEAQAAVRLGSEAESGGTLGNAFFHRVTLLAYLPVALFSVMMLYGIVTGQSLYPRWMVVFLPIVLYLLKIPVTRILRGRLREIVNDSYDNMVWLVFYLLSTVVLWNGVVV